MSLLDLITGNPGTQVAEKAESKFGISKSQIMALLYNRQNEKYIFFKRNVQKK
ncbi:hypothetical protein [Riemerella anatipestifer]|uniref:hypothetical protein n=1 Tax=Riemerella anatipestifer TaxID=34085 RepID=UPI00129DF969|nr:hypothetical protein [Riemerella anatipestifer]